VSTVAFIAVSLAFASTQYIYTGLLLVTKLLYIVINYSTVQLTGIEHGRAIKRLPV